MKQIRIARKLRRPREDRWSVLSLDPRDPDVGRVKAGLSGVSGLATSSGRQAPLYWMR
jgi:hypothetical protein